MGVSFDSLQIERWQKDRDILVAEAQKQGAECLFQDANGDARKQNEQCEILLSQGIDVLVIIPKSATAAAQAVRSAKQQGVPVLSYDRLILECDVDAYISYDNTWVGALQAQSLVDRVKGKYFLLGGAPDDNNAKLLREGQMQVLEPLIKAGEIEIVGDQWASGWSPSKAREIVENLLVNVGTDLNAIVASNDGTAGGAIQALRAQGLDGKVLISGQDADLQACKRILAGTQTVTVYKPLRPLAEQAAALALQLARGESVGAEQEVNNGHIDVPAVLLKPVAVDEDNLMDVIVGDGHHSREALLN
jgi:D-xylose transport system substrate-binding protein